MTEKDDNARVYVSTYPTMLNLINKLSDQGHRSFGPGYFDLVIIDEAHRSIFNKYKAIFNYFDALLVGLTATPKDEIDRNTYRVFNLEEGNPTDAYSLDEAMADTHLVGPFTINVPLKIPQLGIKYDDLSDEEKEKWDEVEWDDDDGAPTEVSADEVNKYLFNADTIDKMLQTVMTYGLKVEGGDRLGKTIIFARNNKHAEFIVDRFNKIYPEQPGDFARVITYQIKGAEHLIDKFRIKDSAPYIAVSVDMLDTGIDIPEIVNLVFAKLVRSKTKFWQMLGRGTRLCRDLFGPGQDKKQFIIFDVARNVEYFNSDIPEADAKVQPSLGERLFAQRTELLYTLDYLFPELATLPATPEPTGAAAVRRGVATRLQAEVAGMDRDNIEVRQHLREVDIYLDADSWKQISAEKRDELKEKLANLPSEYKDDENSEEAKRFDLIALRLQLGLLVGDPGYEALKMQVQRIAEDLLDPTTLNNPVVNRHAEFLSDVAGEDWWQDVTLPMLETMRRTLRGLVRLLPAKRRGVVFTDFQDELGDLTPAELKGMDIGTNRSRFERKIRTYLRSHENDLLVQKLVRGRQISSADLDELKNIFLDLGFGTQADIDMVTDEYHGFGLFLRSITGLRREVAVRAFGKFQQGKAFSPAQYSFVELIIESLTRNGFLDIGHLYEQPFKSRAPRGPDTFFTDPEVGTIIEILDYLKQSAIPNDTAVAS